MSTRRLRTNKEIREVLRSDSSKFLTLLDNFRKGNPFTEQEKEELYLGVSDWVSSLARSHYGQRQRAGQFVPGGFRQWYEPVTAAFCDFDKHQKRMEVAFQFVKESNPETPIKGVVFSFNRRYSWVEMLVELRHLGIEFLPGNTTQQINSTTIRDIITGNSITRKLQTKLRREPTDEEITIEFCSQLLGMGKRISIMSIRRFLSRYHAYRVAKAWGNPILGYDETWTEHSDGNV